jgi:hypothetical protein
VLFAKTLNTHYDSGMQDGHNHSVSNSVNVFLFGPPAPVLSFYASDTYSEAKLVLHRVFIFYKFIG